MIYFLIPIYNEEDNIPTLFNEFSKFQADDDIYFVFSDDGSSDKSLVLIKDLFKNYPYYIINYGINRGPGFAFNAGFEWILNHSKNDKDIVVTLEADCTSDLNLLPKMIAINRLGYDVVLASVYAQGGGFDKTNWFRKLISTFANLLLRFIFNIKILTLSSFYRVYSIDILRKIKQRYSNIITEKGFISMVEILIKAINEKANIIEVPMKLYSHKRKGKSKMKIIKNTLDYIIFLLKVKKNCLKNKT